jgi:hypothetical protein
LLEPFEPAVACPRKNAAAKAAAPSTIAIGTKILAVIASASFYYFPRSPLVHLMGDCFPVGGMHRDRRAASPLCVTTYCA